jgi:hypothetical protein
MKFSKHHIGLDRLRDLLNRKIEKLGDQAGQHNGEIGDKELDSVERLKRLVELVSYTAPSRRKRWPVIVILAATLAAVSLLLFAHVRTTEIELDLSLSELGFRFPRQQALADVMQLSSIGVSGLQKIQLPRVGDKDARTILQSDAAGASILLSAGGSDSSAKGTISLSTLTLMAGSHVGLRPTDLPKQYRLSIKSREWLLRIGVSGLVDVALPGAPAEQLNLKIPGLITLQPDTNIVDLDLRVKNSSKKTFSDQMIVDSLSFFRIDQYTDPEHTVVRRASTVLSGTLYFESLGGQERRLRPGEELDFELSQGEIRTLELQNDHIALAFHGRVQGMTSGEDEHRYSIMPTYLEWLKARHGLTLLWGSTLYLFGLILTVIKWWRSKTAFAVVLCLGSLNVYSQDSEAGRHFDNEFEQTARLTVMLKVEFKDGTSEAGAGFVFGHSNDRLFIATADHVVHGGSPQIQNIWVRLKTMGGGKPVKADFLKSAKAENIDLAVLAIGDLAKQHINPCAFPYDRLPYRHNVKRGDTVYAIGNPDGDSWAEPVDPDKVAQVNEKEIVFQSAMVSGGNSGGPLIDNEANLVGMTTADQPPFARAINMALILGQLKKWGYPVQLNIFYPRGLEPTNLQIAVLKGDLGALKKCIANCDDPDDVDMNYVTALQLAAYWGNLEAMTLLADAGAGLESQDALGDSPMNHAVDRYGNLETIKWLLKAGAKINSRDHQGYTPLLKALTADSLDETAVLFLIHSGAEVNVKDQDEETPLHYASEKWESGNCQSLVESWRRSQCRK